MLSLFCHELHIKVDLIRKVLKYRAVPLKHAHWYLKVIYGLDVKFICLYKQWHV